MEIREAINSEFAKKNGDRGFAQGFFGGESLYCWRHDSHL